jgi:Ca2+-binding EF-hand superfamily protein
METIDWKEFAKKLPIGKTPEESTKRKKLFRDFDPNGNGYLSLAEIDKAFLDVINLPFIYKRKPVLMRAFQAAKTSCPKKSEHSADYIELNEFRYFLIYLRQYLEYFEMFDKIDTNDDKKVTLSEFKLAMPLMEKWGVKVDDPEKTFKEIDQNGGGSILFDEFCHWAIKKNLDLENDDNFYDDTIENMN